MSNPNPAGQSLRVILFVATTSVVALAVVIAGALITLTTLLHETTSSAATSVEGVRLAQEAQVDLLLLGRADGLLKRDIQERLAHRLNEARLLAATVRELALISEAEARVAAYISESRDAATAPGQVDARLEAAYGALDSLVHASVVSARAAHRTAASWDRRANYVGLGAAASLIGMAAWLLVWLERRAFAPIFQLMTAMERFGKGDREARALETGPAELRRMGRHFNEMATALAVRRQAQIAFLGGVAHDLRNPLTALKMSVALIHPDKPLPPEPRVRHIVEKIDRQITRLDRMAGDFLDISRIEAGELELKIEAYDACDLVRAVVHLFEGISPEPHIVVSLPPGPVEVHCDHLRIEQVLTNLISNAIKYSPPGRPVEVAVEAGEEEVIFRVTDKGIGIPEDEQQHVFEPFRRTGLSKETVPGVGLGLYVVRSIVEAHAGRMRLESVVGAGSTFRVCLLRFGALESSALSKSDRAAVGTPALEGPRALDTSS